LNAAESSKAWSRASWSELPPAEKGTTILTGFAGHSCASQAGTDTMASAPRKAAARIRVLSDGIPVVLVGTEGVLSLRSPVREACLSAPA
jgi:hypothetical protein